MRGLCALAGFRLTLATDEKGGYRVVPSHRPMPRDIRTALIEPKTPVYARFEVLAFILTVPKSG
jgi:hypothetical protein